MRSKLINFLRSTSDLPQFMKPVVANRLLDHGHQSLEGIF